MSTPTWWLGPDSCTVGSDSLERNAKGSPRMSSLAVAGWACGFASATNSGFSPEFRFGWEPFVRATVSLGYTFR